MSKRKMTPERREQRKTNHLIKLEKKIISNSSGERKFSESFFKYLKKEELLRHSYLSMNDLKI